MDTIRKAVSLGLGVVVASKEQIEKTVDELVKKGEVGKEESKALVGELIAKGAEARERIERLANDKASAIVGENRYAAKAEVEALQGQVATLQDRVASLEERIVSLEARLSTGGLA